MKEQPLNWIYKIWQWIVYVAGKREVSKMAEGSSYVYAWEDSSTTNKNKKWRNKSKRRDGVHVGMNLIQLVV